MKAVVRSISLILVIWCLAIMSAFGFDFLTTNELGTGGTIILSRPSASELLRVPSGGIGSGEGLVEVGLNRKFELKDLDQGYLAAAYRYDNLIFTAGFTQFGYREFYSERVGKVGVSHQFDSLVVGISMAIMRVEFGGWYEPLNGVSMNGGVSYRHENAFGSIVVENVNAPTLEEGSEPVERRYSLFGEFTGTQAYSILARLTAQKREKPQLGIGQVIHLADMASLYWGFETEPTTYGGGVELTYKDMEITYATSYHPALGFSHTISFSYEFGARMKE